MEQQQQHSSDDREEGSSSPGIASYEYMHPIDENLKCPICHSAFLVPYMSRTCEHVYCHQCIVAHLTSSSTVGVDENGDSATTTTCPCDRTPLRLDDPQSGGHSGQLVPAPRIVKLLCDELQVACTAPGCTWTGQRADWDRHARVDCLSAREESQSAAKVAAAATTSTACNHGCGARLASKGDLEKHEQEECIRRSVKCIMCEEKVVLVDMQDHAEACPYSEIACPQCNNGMFDRLSLVHHLEVDCASTVIACPHARFGCPARDARSVMLEQHVPSECAYEPLKGHLHASEDRLASLERENRELSTSLARLRRQYEDLAGRLESVTVRIGDAPTSANSGRTGRATLFSMEVSLAAVSAQLADLARASAETQRDRERMALDLRGEMGRVQMAVHELKGEMMALQQAHYYESASRYYAARNGQSSAVLPPPLAGSSEGKATSASSVTTSGASSSSATSAGEGTAPYPHYPGLGGYPFPPYAGLPVHMPLASSMSGQPFHSPHLPPHHAIHGSMSMRRLYGHGWPPLYPMYGAGGASPDGGMYGGGTKL